MPTHAPAHPLELKIPPLGVVLMAALLIWLGAVYLPALTFHFLFQSALAWLMGFAGALTAALGIIQFRRAKTTVNPTRPNSASSLVRTGIYRRTRNPMYLGFLFVLTAWAVALGNIASFFILPAYVAYLTRFQIQPEERALAAIFPNDFNAYCAEVRRWI